MLSIVVCCRRVGDTKQTEPLKEETIKLIENQPSVPNSEKVTLAILKRANPNEDSEEESSSEQDEEEKGQLV